MTREVAIKAIQDFIGWFKEDSLIRKALEMAIQALSQEQDMTIAYLMGKYEDKEPCDDAIRREPCRTCKHGEVYNDAWCRCTHYKISGCRVLINNGCEVENCYGIKEPYNDGRE